MFASLLCQITLISVLLSGCNQPNAVPVDRIELEIDGETISAEIADTEVERRRGLMYRRKLGNSEGMWFIFPDQKERSFWMKNTYIPLDIIYISNDLEIVDMTTSVQPCKKDPCPVYPSQKPARYVLEVNAGFVKKHNIVIEDKVYILTSDT